MFRHKIIRIQTASRKACISYDAPSHLSITWGKLTVTKLHNEGRQLWSLVPATAPNQTDGLWLINVDANLALRYDLDTGDIFPAPLDKKDMSFVWSVNRIQVWKDQEDYAFSPIGKPHRRMTTEVVEVPAFSNGTVCHAIHIMNIRLVGDAGSPANQAWVIKPEVLPSLTPEKAITDSPIYAVGAY
ncbi:12051_t:CDS:1 [Ambispora gerdemannii]|uniref:12051_t:CDS:1 n=1 Tax=Ambispora gerdemannii TaxID=144530 RepID=A0A9N9BBZ7_9GLOM|nr:12051_t:CDS:1 [Ambispora gerdemannii]